MLVEVKSLKNNTQSMARDYFTYMLQETQNGAGGGGEDYTAVCTDTALSLCVGTPAVTLT